ncbi:hypothetical protein [Kangiella sediminilitoris]|uniref:Lipoprotein n=1 Tax=Kangiella sediminilitoris TaxID=1144748 RepID=A0A1B3BC50_9GAMM|nr:hypothetical protein [Kangiella sediminilitoris]AOE50335.1 hypothetical protein KS2013_1625 [Kangiella sediminilitoris]
MTTIVKIALLVFSLALLMACNTTPERDYMVDKDSSADYVYIIDYEKVSKIEQAGRTSHSNVDTYWIHPPLKRITRSEYEKLKKGQ